MRELSTIQKREKLNRIFAKDEKSFGGANHEYDILSIQGELNTVMGTIKFQKGARKEKGSQYGIIDTDLLEIVRDRLKCFQAGDFASEYNAKALEYVELALMYLNRRIEDRIERKVLGTNKK